MRKIEDVIKAPFKHGIVERMVRDDYRDACGLNPSSLKQPSPKHVKYAYENQGETTDAMRLGTAVHTLVWEPDLFADEVVAFDGTRRGKEWDAFREEHDGKLILKVDAFERAVEIANAVCMNSQVKELAREGLAETAVLTEEYGCQCRGLIDWLATHLGILCDLKVVASIDPRLFGNAFQRFGWGTSLACYRRWFQREANKEIRAVKAIAVESKPPFDVAVIDVPEEALELGWKHANGMIQRVRECIDTGVWPGISGGEEMQLFIPTFAMDEEEIAWEDAA